MAGQATSSSYESVMARMRAVRQSSTDTGIMGTDTSAIGGMGRKGNAEMPPYKDVCTLGNASGNATTGETGPNSGSGKTL